MTIAFTGATGHFGRLLADALRARTSADNLVALVRDPGKAVDLEAQGIEVRAFDYDQPAGLVPALRGVDRLVLVSGNAVGQRIPQHRAVIEAAAEAGVGFVAYTSFLHTDTAKIIGVAPEHRATEQLLADASFPVALLRNGWYTENFEQMAQQAASTGTLLGSAGTGRISAATRKDLAEAAAVVITAEQPKPATYELAGDRSFTLADLARVVSEASGARIVYRDVSAEEHTKALADAGLESWLVDFFVGTDQAISAGELEDPEPGTLSSLIGHPTTPLAETVKGWLG
jgi:NAD(P)H dehydrogenase (quinone)